MIGRLTGLLAMPQHAATFFAVTEAACSCEALRMPDRIISIGFQAGIVGASSRPSMRPNPLSRR